MVRREKEKGRKEVDVGRWKEELGRNSFSIVWVTSSRCADVWIGRRDVYGASIII
jgi:hypothetical protein